MKAIIFGASGQDGHYLTRYLQSINVPVIGFSRKAGYNKIDYSKFQEIKDLLVTEKPTHVFHFAANSSVKHELLFENFEIIDKTTINLLEAVKQVSSSIKVFLSGSALQFENHGLPIDENTPFCASSPYAISRINTTYMARYFREKFGLLVYVGYFFHHDSPLRTDKHINKMICDAIIKISLGKQENLIVGNMEVQKEFNFAADTIRAVWTLTNQNNIFEAVIGSGVPYKISDWVRTCFELKNLDYKEFVSEDEKFKPDFKILVSNPKLIKSLGWSPNFNMKDLAEIMINNNLDKY